MDAVPGAMSVPLRSLPHEKSRAVNRSLTYDSALEDAQCPYMREKDMAPSRATEPAEATTPEPKPSGPAQAMAPAPTEATAGPAEPARRHDRTPVKKHTTKSNLASPPQSSTPPSSSTPPTKKKPKSAKSPTYWKIFVCNIYIHIRPI